MKHYCIDEFIRSSTEDTINTAVDKKINLLYDFCILRREQGLGYDTREHRLRRILSQYSNEYTMSNALHPILVGNITLNDYLKSKEIM